MFCEQCGSKIPDGAKFCTECGSPIAAAPAPVEQPAEDFSIPQSSAPGSAPTGAETPFWQQPSAEPAASTWQQPAASDWHQPSAEPAASTWQQPAAEPAATDWRQPSAEPAAEPRSTDSGLGYSTPGSGTSHSYTTPAPANPEIKSSGSRWWLWLIIGLVIVALLVAAGYLLLRARTSDEPLTPPATAGSIRDNAFGLVDAVNEKEAEVPQIDVPGVDVPGVDVPGVDIPGVDVPEESEVPAIEADADIKALTDKIDQHLTEENYFHEIEVNDGNIVVYIWYDGVDDLSDRAAIDGDADALAKWNEDVEYMRRLSEDILADLDSIGQADYYYSIAAIQDDVYPDAVIAYAADGVVIYDWVNEIDIVDEFFED